MRIGTVERRDGQVVIEGLDVAPGQKVTVFQLDEGEIEISPEIEAELLGAIAEIERGEFIHADTLLKELEQEAR